MNHFAEVPPRRRMTSTNHAIVPSHDVHATSNIEKDVWTLFQTSRAVNPGRVLKFTEWSVVFTDTCKARLQPVSIFQF